MTLPANRLPGRHEGADGLIELAQRYSPEQVFDLIVLCRTARGRGQDEGNLALTKLAKVMVNGEMRRGNVDYDEARRRVAYRLGYQDGGSRSNFYKILTGGRAPEKRPHSSARGNS